MIDIIFLIWFLIGVIGIFYLHFIKTTIDVDIEREERHREANRMINEYRSYNVLPSRPMFVDRSVDPPMFVVPGTPIPIGLATTAGRISHLEDAHHYIFGRKILLKSPYTNHIEKHNRLEKLHNRNKRQE